MTALIRTLRPDDAGACDEIVASLPDFFEMEEGIQACAQAVRTESGLVAVEGEEVRAFVTFERHFHQSAEITWMATHAEHRRRGLGGALIQELAANLAEEGRRLLVVFTLSPNDPLDEEDGYASTRRFYQRHGFALVRDIPELWPGNVAVLMARPLDAVGGAV